MLKLIYDLRAGFEDCYLTIKDEEYDISDVLEIEKLCLLDSPAEVEPETLEELRTEREEEIYNNFHNNIVDLLKYLEDNGIMDLLYEDSVLTISKLYFSHMLGGTPIKHTIPIWKPSNWRLVYDPDTRSSFYYLNAMSAKEVYDTLKLTKQQLHYYVKTGQIRKESNPKNQKQFKYNRTDVYVLQKKLEKKYARYV